MFFCTDLKLLKGHSKATVLFARIIQQCCGMLKVPDVGRVELQKGALLHEDVSYLLVLLPGKVTV